MQTFYQVECSFITDAVSSRVNDSGFPGTCAYLFEFLLVLSPELGKISRLRLSLF